MKKTLGTTLIGLSLLATTSAFAMGSFQITSPASSGVTQKTASVQCNNIPTEAPWQGLRIATVLNTPVPYVGLQVGFLNGHLTGICHFTLNKKVDGKYPIIGVGTIDIASKYETATISDISTGKGYSVTETGNGTDKLVVNLAKA